MLITLIVPVYNEEKAVSIFHAAARSILQYDDIDFEILFINDGSEDATLLELETLARLDPLVRVINLTRNFGKEAALIAGLEHAHGDAAVPIDVDLQDPLDVIIFMIEKWKAGADIVLGKRIDRSVDGVLKRLTSLLFYRLHNVLSQPRIEENVGDFRLISRKMLLHVRALPERNLFMKGLLSWVGGKTEIVEYRRAPRITGKSKFNAWKLWNLAVEGITGFSTAPLKIGTYLGFVIAMISFGYGIWMALDKVIFDNPVPGYPSIITAIMFFSGVQIIGLGVIGEYLGRIYIEVKRRPRYVVDKEISSTTNSAPKGAE